jgi:hypothetical protein
MPKLNRGIIPLFTRKAMREGVKIKMVEKVLEKLLGGVLEELAELV